MLRNAHEIYGLPLLAKDGNIGHVDDIYFDDQNWTMRYLVANTGNWLIGRRVLIAPHALESVDWWGVDGLRVALTKQQIEDSPSVSTAEPVTRRVERDYYRYYGWPFYWGGAYAWGTTDYPFVDEAEATRQEPTSTVEDSHLHSSKEVDGYHVHASDGDIGHVCDFIFDERTWAIRYLVVDTRNWIPGKKVLITPEWVLSVGWDDRKLHVDIPRETIKNAPEYNHDAPLDAAYEAKLNAYYELETQRSLH